MNKHQVALISVMMQHAHFVTASEISEGAIYQVTKYNGGHLGLCSAGMRRAGCLDLQRVMFCTQAEVRKVTLADKGRNGMRSKTVDCAQSQIMQ